MTTPSAELLTVCKRVPLFPLPGVVFLPSTKLPLHVFEPRYRALVENALDGHRHFAVPLLSPGWEPFYQDRPPVHRRCCLGRIEQVERLDDGRFHLVLDGRCAVDIVQELTDPSPFRWAEVAVVAENTAHLKEALIPLRPMVERIAHRVLAREPSHSPSDLRRLAFDALDPLAYLYVAAHCLLKTDLERQAFLDLDDPEGRVDILLRAALPFAQGAQTAEA